MDAPARIRSHPLVWALLGFVLVFAGTNLLPGLWHQPEARSTGSYCTALGQVERRIAETRQVIAERDDPAFDLGPSWPPNWSTLRHMRNIVYPPSIVDQGPPGTGRDARIVLDGLRSSIERGSSTPLDQPRFRAAAARLGPPSKRACDQAERGR